jgi:hypothetical protein
VSLRMVFGMKKESYLGEWVVSTGHPSRIEVMYALEGLPLAGRLCCSSHGCHDRGLISPTRMR